MLTNATYISAQQNRLFACLSMSYLLKKHRCELLVWGSIKEMKISNIPLDILKIVLAYFYSLKYTAFGYGYNAGQFGITSTKKDGNQYLDKWTKLSALSNLIADHDKIYHSRQLFKIRNGLNEIYLAGINEYGQIGTGSSKQYNIFNYTKLESKQANNIDTISRGFTADYSIIKTKDNKFYGWGSAHSFIPHSTKPTFMKSTTDGFKDTVITMICVAESHSLFLTSTGKVFSAGSNKYGNCGFPIEEHAGIKTPKLVSIGRESDVIIKHIECRCYHNLVLTQHDGVYGWGLNDSGQLGISFDKEKGRDTKCTQQKIKQNKA